MKKINFLFIAIMFLFITACSSRDNYDNRLDRILSSGVIVVATSPDYPPFEFIDPSRSGMDRYVGADMELARFIADYLGVELQIQAVNFDATLAAVTTGRADIVISGLSYRPERAEAMHLTDFFGGEGYQGILIRREMLDYLNEASDFDGLTIGAQAGSIPFNMVQDQLPNANAQMFAAIPEGIMSLQSGRIDAYAIGGIAGERYAITHPELAMANFRFETENSQTVAGVALGETELLNKINEIIAIVNEEGLYYTWLEEAKELAALLHEG